MTPGICFILIVRYFLQGRSWRNWTTFGGFHGIERRPSFTLGEGELGHLVELALDLANGPVAVVGDLDAHRQILSVVDDGPVETHFNLHFTRREEKLP